MDGGLTCALDDAKPGGAGRERHLQTMIRLETYGYDFGTHLELSIEA